MLSHDALEALQAGAPGQSWYAFRTRPRREKKAAETFADMGLRHYLPLRTKTTRRRGGQFTSQVPLFAGYAFGCCDLRQRLSAMRSGHLAQWIEVVDQEQLLRELRDIHRATVHGDGLALYPQLKRGKVVRVVNGPLAGVRGRISRREDRFRLVIEVTALGTGVAVTVDMADVELVSGHADDVIRLGDVEVVGDERGLGVVRR